MQPTRLLPLLALAAMAACTDDTLIDPAADFAPAASVGSPATNPISVQTRNVYVGADVDAVIAAVLERRPGR